MIQEITDLPGLPPGSYWPNSLKFWEVLQQRRAAGLLADVRRWVIAATRERQADIRGILAGGWPGLLIWLNTCIWLYEPRAVQNRRRIPMATWSVQDDVAPMIWWAIQDQHNLCTDKSRDMSASWLCLLTMLWYWLFEKDSLFTMASRVEDDVDAKGDPDSLFWKIDYALDCLPTWLVPVGWRDVRKHLHIGNPLNGSVLSGESSSAHVARGGRRKAILLDEFASASNALAILSSTADATDCRIFNSTPQGAGHFDEGGTVHGNVFAAVRHSNTCRVITLHWSQHPTKGRGRYIGHRGKDGARGWVEPLDAGYKYPRGYRFIMDDKVRSPWYDAECRKRGSRQEIAQNLDIDYLSSGSMFFDSPVFARIRASGSLTPPTHCGSVAFNVTTSAGRINGIRRRSIRWVEDARDGRVSLWCPILRDPSNKLVERPPQLTKYVAFCDIGLGNGSSNSVMDIIDVMRREQVAQFATAVLPPQEFATACVAMLLWFRGANGWPFLGWERNGPGEEFGPQVLRLKYPFVYRQRKLKERGKARKKDVGWWSDRNSKRTLLGELRGTLGRSELTVHCERSMVEAEQYINYESGGVGPSSLTEEPEGARATHGDRVIALAGANMMATEVDRVKIPESAAPEHSFADRRNEHLKKQKALAAQNW